ncbi:EPIDERMAL PATTERNING FACTOR-like protein 6 [Acorus calamus]|uniref:Epidermal patterning factor-like protein n=1 Tax=Acorus calamus TaxID=4465 RepID=A0AAV9CA32_ACOCL|nr:EPIDERMAL PATTERNING FACTOR-like protein 6 [Acorus calamus]
MEAGRRKSRRVGLMSKKPSLLCLVVFLFSVFALMGGSMADGVFIDITRSSLCRTTNCATKGSPVVRRSIAAVRRDLSGPGSFPPRCTSKCGRCTPCRPVHVPVPPGTPVTTEYYPEAWRCKCGNKLFMP